VPTIIALEIESSTALKIESSYPLSTIVYGTPKLRALLGDVINKYLNL